MINVKNIDHVVLRAVDPEKMIRFYRDVLGCRVEKQSSPEMGLYQMRAGQSLIDIVAVDGELGRKGGGAPGKEGRNMDHFCVRIESFDEQAIWDFLQQHNIHGSEVETHYGADGYGLSLYIHDPEGNTIELKGPGTG